MKKFWNWRDHRIRNKDTGEEITERVLELYGTIAEESWFDDDITPEMFRQELFAGSGPVTIWINSPGGDCIAASQIYTMLMDYKGDVTVKIDGIAASAASVIAMAGTKVLMSPTGMLMIHNPAMSFTPLRMYRQSLPVRLRWHLVISKITGSQTAPVVPCRD